MKKKEKFTNWGQTLTLHFIYVDWRCQQRRSQCHLSPKTRLLSLRFASVRHPCFSIRDVCRQYHPVIMARCLVWAIIPLLVVAGANGRTCSGTTSSQDGREKWRISVRLPRLRPWCSSLTLDAECWLNLEKGVGLTRLHKSIPQRQQYYFIVKLQIPNWRVSCALLKCGFCFL